MLLRKSTPCLVIYGEIRASSGGYRSDCWGPRSQDLRDRRTQTKGTKERRHETRASGVHSNSECKLRLYIIDDYGCLFSGMLSKRRVETTGYSIGDAKRIKRPMRKYDKKKGEWKERNKGQIDKIEY